MKHEPEHPNLSVALALAIISGAAFITFCLMHNKQFMEWLLEKLSHL